MLKSECIQPKVPLSLEDARKIVGESVSRFNDSQLCSAGDFVTPWRKLQGQESRIFAQLEQNLVAAGENRGKLQARIFEPEVGRGHLLAVGLVFQQCG